MLQVQGVKTYLNEVIWDYVENNKTGREFFKNNISNHIDIGEEINFEVDFLYLLAKVKKIPNNERVVLSNLGSLINLLIFSNDSPILIFKMNLDENTKEVIPVRGLIESKFTETNQTGTDLSSASIRLPLRPIYEKIFESNIKDETFQAYKLITEKEAEILEIIRSGEFKELIVTPGKKEPKIKLTSSGSIKGDKVKEIRKLLGLKEYQSLTLKFRNDKDIYFENTLKK